MTRRRLNRTLYTTVAGVAFYGALMLAVALWDIDQRIYEIMRDAAPLIIGIAAAILANAFQKRGRFIDFLRDEWYNIVLTKTTLVTFVRKPNKSYEEALEAWGSLSMAIDRMRILYRNVGETNALIGYYPYEPLHDMRRAFEGALGVGDANGKPGPVGALEVTPQQLDAVDWRAVEAEIWTAFGALREVFLEELDMEEPVYPLLAPGAARKKRPGATDAATATLRRAIERAKRG